MITSAFLLIVIFQDIGIRISDADVGTNNSSIQEGESPTRTYHSTFDTLVNGASNNSIINISTTTVLSSIVVLEYLENITIIGDSIDCKNTGSVKFISCKNVTFEGISWERCGSSTNPAIGFTHSSNVVIQSCSFHHSTGQAVVMSNMSGNVYINNCQFTHNNEYKGHGTAIHISQSENHVQSKTVIDKCNFALNGPAQSVVYVDDMPTFRNLIIQNSVFVQNEGVPIYISFTSLHLNDNLLFEQNEATAGGGIYSIHSNIVFHDTSDVTFHRNSAQTNGGCMVLNESNVSFIGKSTAEFTNNHATQEGGVIYLSSKSNISFSNISTLMFSNNSANDGGGALQCGDNSYVNFDDTVSVQFVNNSAQVGGAIHSPQNSDCVIAFDGNSSVTFASNRADNSGGAISGSATITFDGKASIIFASNMATPVEDRTKGTGGAISVMYSSISFNGSTSIKFDNNKASDDGGAIYGVSSTITSDNNASISFLNNRVTSTVTYTEGRGGAISVIHSKISFNGSTSMKYDANTASYSGGAIYGDSSVITSDGTVSITFHNNRATRGGAISVSHYSSITVNGNTSIKFEKNIASYRGGAIYGDDSVITFDENVSMTFLDNRVTTTTAMARGTGGAISVSGSNISFSGSTSVKYLINIADDSGAIYGDDSAIITFNGNASVNFLGNRAYGGKGGAIRVMRSNIIFSGNSSITFCLNEAAVGGAIYGFSMSTIISDGNASITFVNNNAYTDQCDQRPISEGKGGAISIDRSVIVFNGNTSVQFDNNQADFGGAIYGTRANTSFSGKNMSVTFLNNYASVNGGAVHGDDSTIVFDGNMSIIFHGNHADQYGGAIGVHSGSNVKFDGKLMSATFDNNNAGMNGGAIYGVHTDIAFNGKKLVEFVRNNAGDSGGGIHGKNSNIFDGNMSVTFVNNCANNDGSAMYAVNSNITFDGDVSVMFHDNCKANRGGAFYGEGSNILFNGNVSGMFINNSATKGGAYYGCSTVIKFSGGTSVKFVTNFATDGGAVCGIDHSEIIFDENTEVQFSRNTATHGAAVYISTNSSVTSSGDSIINFAFNSAVEGGGALYTSEPNIILNENTSQSVYASSIKFSGNSTTLFSSNTATRGGVVCSLRKSSISFYEDSTVNFNHNIGTEGGALYLEDDVGVSFDGNTSVTFTNNSAETGGAIYARKECYIVFNVNSQVNFSGNQAKLDGGAIAFVSSSIVSFTGTSLNYKIARQNSKASMKDSGIRFCGNSSVTLQSNKAMQCGGAIYSFSGTVIIFEGDSNVMFNNNKAKEQGGAVYLTSQSFIFFMGNSQVVFVSNEASLSGGAIGSLGDGLIYTGDASNLTFFKNSCSYFGGAIYLFENTTAIFSGYSQITFQKNTATSGGAMYLDNNFTLSFDDYSNVTYLLNYVDQYGGAVYGNLVGNINSKIIVNATFNHTHFQSNTASSGPNIYMDIPTKCDNECRNHIIVDGSYDDFFDSNFTDYIRTQPSKLVLNNIAKCVHHGNDSDMNCINSTYLVEGIMLGQEIIIDACVLDHFNNTASATQFTVNSNNETYYIDGPDVILISCDKFRGIRITGSEVGNPINVSMTITSQIDSQSDFKRISIQLITKLSPCHPGFHYSNTTQRCECYSETNIVICLDDHTSIIKRGYWFGQSPGIGKATVSVCPKNYCSFDCCEATDVYYQLSPERHNQCSSHRSGTACGSCEEDYTLSFDSVECVSIDKCTTGQTVMVVTLSMIYWIVIVILVFIMTYYHVGIGYLYAITYYYSMLDILLGQNLYLFQGLFTTVSIITSIAKITPQFLGHFCLVENMSGIDQQFIHYVHPLAVTIIVALLCKLARISYRFSAFVSRGIIRVICYLLLLSYTSVATTSLLLLRSLTFDNVDKVYTYLSPDIEYCHGRHLPYFIVAVLCTLVIVIGLPLLLLLEPFLNHKINFTRMKPLLDQFQGYYKDKHRCFAAYYMICRLIILVMIIANPTLNITAQFLLVALCTTLALIQLNVRPYASNTLNIFDGFLLQIMILVSMAPLVDIYDENLFLSLAFISITLPLIVFVVMELFIHRKVIKKISARVCHKPIAHSNYLLMDDSVAPRKAINLNRLVYV